MNDGQLLAHIPPHLIPAAVTEAVDAADAVHAKLPRPSTSEEYDARAKEAKATWERVLRRYASADHAPPLCLAPASHAAEVTVCIDGIVRLFLDTGRSREELTPLFAPEDRARAGAEYDRQLAERSAPLNDGNAPYHVFWPPPAWAHPEGWRLAVTAYVAQGPEHRTALLGSTPARKAFLSNIHAVHDGATSGDRWFPPPPYVSAALAYAGALGAIRIDLETERVATQLCAEHVAHGLGMAFWRGVVRRAQVRPPVCVAVLVTNAANQLLLVKHRVRGTWELPGGKMRLGETWRDCARREALEEAGLEVEVDQNSTLPVIDLAPGVVLIASGTAEGEPFGGSDAADARWFNVDEIPWDDLSRIGSAQVVRNLAGICGMNPPKEGP